MKKNSKKYALIILLLIFCLVTYASTCFSYYRQSGNITLNADRNPMIKENRFRFDLNKNSNSKTASIIDYNNEFYCLYDKYNKPQILNDNTSFEQEIDLYETLDYGDSISPGSEGLISFYLDLSNVGYDVDYSISYEKISAPNNLHFYTDSSFEEELTTYEGEFVRPTDDSYAEPYIYEYIYWKWEWLDDDESNANDTSFMNQPITVKFNVNVTEKTS